VSVVAKVRQTENEEERAGRVCFLRRRADHRLRPLHLPPPLVSPILFTSHVHSIDLLNYGTTEDTATCRPLILPTPGVVELWKAISRSKTQELAFQVPKTRTQWTSRTLLRFLRIGGLWFPRRFQD